MKKIIVIISVLLFCINIGATKYYCEVKGTEKGISTGLKIIFDFGTSPVYSGWAVLKGKQKLVDDKGEEIPFNSMVDAGNYMSSKGWSFVQAYTSIYDGNAILHWIFVKEADTPEEAIKGIMTKEMFDKKK